MPRAAIEDVLAGRLNLRDLHLPPGYRDEAGSLFEDPKGAQTQFAALLGHALAAGWADEAEALAEPSRLSLLRMVALGEATGGRALAARSGLAPATVSRHMAQLARAGLVTSHVHGREVRYELDPAAVRSFGPHLLHVLGQPPPPEPPPQGTRD